MMLWGAAWRHCSTVQSGNDSPQNREYRNDGKAPGLRSLMRPIITAVEGTENHTVSWCSCRNRAGAINCVAGTTWSEAPTLQALAISATERSKFRSNSCENRSVGRKEKR